MRAFGSSSGSTWPSESLPLRLCSSDLSLADESLWTRYTFYLPRYPFPSSSADAISSSSFYSTLASPVTPLPGVVRYLATQRGKDHVVHHKGQTTTFASLSNSDNTITV